MTGYLGLYRNFFIIITVIMLCAAAKTSHWTSFHRLPVDQERLSSPFRKVGNASGLQCSAVCHEEEECLAFNYHAVTGDCELINSSGLQLETLFTEDFGWTVYRKGPCDEGFVLHGGSCYMFSKEGLNWAAAENACGNLGSHLAEINDETENAFLKSIAGELGQIFWLGASDHIEEGDLRWVHSQTRISDSTFSDWGPNSPDNTGGNEHYMALVYDWYWGDANLSKSYPYICEMKKWD